MRHEKLCQTTFFPANSLVCRAKLDKMAHKQRSSTFQHQKKEWKQEKSRHFWLLCQKVMTFDFSKIFRRFLPRALSGPLQKSTNQKTKKTQPMALLLPLSFVLHVKKQLPTQLERFYAEKSWYFFLNLVKNLVFFCINLSGLGLFWLVLVIAMLNFFVFNLKSANARTTLTQKTPVTGLMMPIICCFFSGKVYYEFLFFHHVSQRPLANVNAHLPVQRPIVRSLAVARLSTIRTESRTSRAPTLVPWGCQKFNLRAVGRVPWPAPSNPVFSLEKGIPNRRSRAWAIRFGWNLPCI